MRFMVVTASTGYWPEADSADSITASAPSKIAVATSETSARVALLRGERCGLERGVGTAHARAGGELAADLDASDRALRRGLDRGEPDRAVVERQRVPGLERGEDFRMRQMHAFRVARRRIG